MCFLFVVNIQRKETLRHKGVLNVKMNFMQRLAGKMTVLPRIVLRNLRNSC